MIAASSQHSRIPRGATFIGLLRCPLESALDSSHFLAIDQAFELEVHATLAEGTLIGKDFETTAFAGHQLIDR
jgi:hypothetical protein